MFTSDLMLGSELWLATFVLGLISLPLSTKFFPTLTDRGYFLGKILGLLIIAYTLFSLATLKVLPLGFNSLIFLSLVWAALNCFVWWKNKKLDIPWKLIFLEEVIFLVCYSLLIYIKGHQPEIYQIERFMDYGFIKALTQARFLPLEDIWRAGEPLNYYYFGHFLAYVLITLSKVGTIVGFFLVQCWLFASAGLLAFSIGSSLVKAWAKTKWAIVAGLFSLFATIFAGDWQTFVWYLTTLRSTVTNLPALSFWYPDPTRIIPGTISEIPIYSFIVADLHAHVWGFLIGSAILCVLVSIWLKKQNYLSNLLSLSFLLGLSIMTNTWDFLTLSSVVFLSLIFKFKDHSLIKQAAELLLVFLLPLFFALPWLFYFKSPIGGIGVVTKWSPPVAWLLFWGPSIFLIFVYFFSLIRKKLSLEKDGLILIFFFISIIWLAFLEIFYMKDILSGGEWFRANTYFKISLQVLLWVGAITGPAIFLVLMRFKGKTKLFFAAIFSLWLLTRAVYPIKALNQSSLEGKSYTGLSSGLSFWQTKYPDDYQAFSFLQSQPRGVLLEADGDSYQDTNFFSSLLGWPTVTGWPVHEWTWHGSYDEVGKRAAEVREIYTGLDLQKAQETLKKYKVKYIIIGSTERRKYLDLNTESLESFGNTIFQNSGTQIIETNL